MKNNNTSDPQRVCGFCGFFAPVLDKEAKTPTPVLMTSTPDDRATKMDAFSPRSRTSSTPIPIMKSDEVVHEQNEDSGSVKLYDSTGDVWQLEGGYSPTGIPVGVVFRDYVTQHNVAKEYSEMSRIASVATTEGDYFSPITASQGDKEEKESPLPFTMEL